MPQEGLFVSPFKLKRIHPAEDQCQWQVPTKHSENIYYTCFFWATFTFTVVQRPRYKIEYLLRKWDHTIAQTNHKAPHPMAIWGYPTSNSLSSSIRNWVRLGTHWAPMLHVTSIGRPQHRKVMMSIVAAWCVIRFFLGAESEGKNALFSANQHLQQSLRWSSFQWTNKPRKTRKNSRRWFLYAVLLRDFIP